MCSFLLFCLATVGLTAILVDGTIFAPFRERLAAESQFLQEKRREKNLPEHKSFKEILHNILSCYQCCGFWSGLFCGFFFSSLLPLHLHGWSLFNLPLFFIMLFFYGTIGSILAHIYRVLLELVFVTTVYLQKATPDHQEHLSHSQDEQGQG
ncbi:MAG: DUF1360 domain-containing protein [Thermoguttaceae bacterium]